MKSLTVGDGVAKCGVNLALVQREGADHALVFGSR